MNCTSFREVVRDLDFEDALDPHTYDAAVEHAQSCTRCARLIYQTRQLDASLRALARADANRGASPRVERQLLEVFRAHAPARVRVRRLMPWLEIAAALLVVAGGFLLWHRGHRPARVQSMARVVAVGPSASVSPPDAAPARALVPSPTTEAAGGGQFHAPKAAARPDESEELGEFMELPYADDDGPLGAGEIVTVRLPESDLALLGLPVIDDGAARAITVDVVIGEDGVARAIRFDSPPESSEVAQLQPTTSESKGANQP